MHHSTKSGGILFIEIVVHLTLAIGRMVEVAPTDALDGQSAFGNIKTTGNRSAMLVRKVRFVERHPVGHTLWQFRLMLNDILVSLFAHRNKGLNDDIKN